MKKFVKSVSCMAVCAMMAASLAACSDDEPNGGGVGGEQSAKDVALKAAIDPYVDNTVIPNYKVMADEAMELYDLCAKARDSFVAGDVATANGYISDACEHWTRSREAWELSEAWLYGAAADYNIDPHIDSWPLDKQALVNLLANASMMQQIGESGGAYVSANLGYGLLGFHAIEYMLYELSADGQSSSPRDLSHTLEGTTVTDNHLIYMAAVAEDLRNQCVRLEASWAGMDNVTQEKQQILTDNELEPTKDYGQDMKLAGQPGSNYQSLTLAAQQIIQGAIDIVNEVNVQKIGRPHSGQSTEDKNYIESPYALNSIVDFADNIRSVRNAYEGQSGDASISDYVATVAPDVDSEVRSLIQESIDNIMLIPEPFALHATEQSAATAMESLTKLETALDKVNDVLINN